MALQELKYQLKCMLPLEPQTAECDERLLEAAAAEDRPSHSDPRRSLLP
jgi:hypothetical protein